MKRKYKRFLKAAYINYEEDYCSNAVLRDNRPPQSEILAPATFELTLSAGEGYYWTTFYTSMANYQAPEGVIVYKEHLDGNTITSSAVDDRIINKRQGVVLRSSTSSITLTKTYSRSSDNYSDNSLIGTDYNITNPGYAYVLGNKSPRGIGFYKLSSTGKIKANKAYLIIPITYLTQWRIVGNSEVHGNEIWSCGEYSATDGKYHIVVLPLGKSPVDIALDEPLRKVNDIADTIEFPSDTEGKALVTRKVYYDQLANGNWIIISSGIIGTSYWQNTIKATDNAVIASALVEEFNVYSYNDLKTKNYTGFAISNFPVVCIWDDSFVANNAITQAFYDYIADKHFIAELATPTTELVDVSQIEEADSYSMVISQGGKAVSWSSFTTE